MSQAFLSFSLNLRMKRKGKTSFALCSIIISIFLNLYFHFDSDDDEHDGDKKSITKDSVIRNHTNSRSQIYELNGDVRIHRISSGLRISASSPNETLSYWTVKPYARHHSPIAMSKVEEMTIALHPRSDFYRIAPNCTRNFHVPAVVFSTGGYADHAYHSVGDVVVPLYFTSHRFDGDVVFLVSDFRSDWVSRYRSILERLSNYDIVDLDADDRTLCFSRVIVGLDADREEFVSGPKHFTNHSMTDFTRFMRNTYSLGRQSNAKKNPHSPPRLLIITREKTRRLLNGGEIADLCKKVGFRVDTKEITGDFEIIARYMHRFDVIVAVHGAGLVNMMFLPENSVVVQIIPYGMDDISRHYFQKSANEMNLKYLKYEVGWNESSLAQKYSRYDEVSMDPYEIRRRDWKYFRSIYFDDQDVTIDVNRFETILVQAFRYLRN